jgi:hypothetical protein
MPKLASYESPAARRGRTERTERAWCIQARERALPALRAALALPDLVDVSARRESAEEDAPRVFYLHLADGTAIRIGAVHTLADPRKLEASLRDALGHDLPHRDASGWHRVIYWATDVANGREALARQRLERRPAPRMRPVAR